MIRTQSGNGAVGLTVTFLLLVVTALSGCSSEQAAKSDPKPKGSDAKAPTGEVTEAQAKDKLKIALDSWVFGDSREKFEKDHPDIYFQPSKTRDLYKPLRYEVQAARKSGKAAYEFSVLLEFQSKAGTEIKETVKYEVDAHGTGGKWDITIPLK